MSTYKQLIIYTDNLARSLCTCFIWTVIGIWLDTNYLQYVKHAMQQTALSDLLGLTQVTQLWYIQSAEATGMDEGRVDQQAVRKRCRMQQQSSNSALGNPIGEGVSAVAPG